MRYYAPAQQVVLRGRVTPAVPGEVLTLYAIRKGKATKKIRRKVRNGGRFEFGFKVGKPGLVRLVVKHQRQRGAAAFRTERKMIQVVDWQAGVGERGLKVLLLQRALSRRGTPRRSPATTTTPPRAGCSPSARPTRWAATATRPRRSSRC